MLRFFGEIYAGGVDFYQLLKRGRSVFLNNISDITRQYFVWSLVSFYFVCSFSVHPCQRANKGGCDHKCTQDGKERTCSCTNDIDFQLQDDGKTCKPGKMFTINEKVSWYNKIFCSKKKIFHFSTPGLRQVHRSHQLVHFSFTFLECQK